MKANKRAYRRDFLAQMPTQGLDKMLQAEVQKENVDEELVRSILDELESREMDYAAAYNPGIAEAMQKFEDTIGSASTKVKYPRVLKAASILLVVGLLLFGLPRAVRAESFFEMLARWSDSVFAFFHPSESIDQSEYVFETDNPGLQQIYDAVVELGITDPVVPMWLPEGYELGNIKVDEWPTETTLYANFKKNESNIYISIIARKEGAFFQHSKDTRQIEKCEIADVSHYIIHNNDEIVATWVTDKIECVIVIDCQEDIYKILKSIYAMEVY